MSEPKLSQQLRSERKVGAPDMDLKGFPDPGNEPVFTPTQPPAGRLATPEATFRRMSDAPADLPYLNEAVQGLCVALKALEQERPGVSGLRHCIESLPVAAPKSAAAGATIVALNRRKGRHLIFALLREIGRASSNGAELDTDLLRLVATWCIRMLLDGHQPSGAAIAKVRVGLLYPKEKVAMHWTTKARSRAISAATRGLDACVKKHPTFAASFGLATQKIRVAVANTPMDHFNRAFRRRVENLIDFHTLDAVAGAGGYGTLSVSSLREYGAELLEMACTGDLSSLIVCMEITTHLPSEVVLKMPVSMDGKRPMNALAWLDIKNGAFCQILYKIEERGASFPVGHEHLYEQTIDIVTVMLSPPIHSLLLELSAEHEGDPFNIEDLTGDARHHPRSRVVGSGGYKVTSRRLQDSVPTLLLQQGFHRWPVALSTTSHHLVSVGRRSYGVCRSAEIDKVVRASHELLGWPVREDASPIALVGAPTTPKSSTVSANLNLLANRADACGAEGKSYEAVVDTLNSHAHWVSMMLALCLALRRWNLYELKTAELLCGDLMNFVDKDVHLYRGPGVPVAASLRQALDGWFDLCRRSVIVLNVIGGPAATDLANQISERIDGTQKYGGVFTIDQVGRAQSVGHRTWVEQLPENLKMRANFARHLWPLKLMDLGIDQTTIDLLTRHQIEGLHPNSSNALRKVYAMQSKLRNSIDKAIGELSLKFPQAFGGAKK